MQKLTQDQVQEIRTLATNPGHTVQGLARRFGMSKGAILLVIQNNSFRDGSYVIPQHWIRNPKSGSCTGGSFGLLLKALRSPTRIPLP